jgi:hypothetical protein
MPVFDYNEALYGALCYIYGDDDNTISVDEKEGFKPRFLERHYLSHETMKTISYRWSSLNVEEFYWEVVNSLNEHSLTDRMEGFKTICIIINDFSANRDDRWTPANRLREDPGFSREEYNRYTGN